MPCMARHLIPVRRPANYPVSCHPSHQIAQIHVLKSKRVRIHNTFALLHLQYFGLNGLKLHDMHRKNA
jgi:hypothetical protein